MLIRPASGCQDKREDYQSEHNQYFGAGQPEFELSEESHAEVINGDDSCEDNGDVDSSIGTGTIVVGFVEPISDYED